jgi:hypothetical protein
VQLKLIQNADLHNINGKKAQGFVILFILENYPT